MGKKYSLLNGKGIHQIKALIDIPGVCKKGDLGGYIESEKNLSHEGRAWVSGSAIVTGNAYVFGNARVYGMARVYGDARVTEDAHVYDNAIVSGNAWVSGSAIVSGDARVIEPINFNCDFNVWDEVRKLLFNKKNMPILMGMNSNIDKILAHKLKE